MRAVEMNSLHRRVSRIASTAQILRPSRNPQDATAVRDDLVASEHGAGMKNFYVWVLGRRVETRDRFSLRTGDWIITACHYHAHGRQRTPFQLNFIEAAVH